MIHLLLLHKQLTETRMILWWNLLAVGALPGISTPVDKNYGSGLSHSNSSASVIRFVINSVLCRKFHTGGWDVVIV